MKLIKSTSIVCISLITLFSSDTFADEPVDCGWEFVRVESGIYGATVYYDCKDGNTLAASRKVCYGSAQHTCTCAVWPSAGYTNKGSCTNPYLL